MVDLISTTSTTSTASTTSITSTTSTTSTASTTSKILKHNAMKEIRKKSIKEICHQVDLIINDPVSKIDYDSIYYPLDSALSKKVNLNEVTLFCETIIKLAKSKGRKIAYIEKDFWKLANKIPYKITVLQSLDNDVTEELLPDTDYNNADKKILSHLIGYMQKIMKLKDDHSKRSDIRRSTSLRIIAGLNYYYHIPFTKSIFTDSITSRNKDEQYEALQGLEMYYKISGEKIEDETVQTLNHIINKTDERTVASTCLQIQINAGLINEMKAVFAMDDWKDKNYRDF